MISCQFPEAFCICLSEYQIGLSTPEVISDPCQVPKAKAPQVASASSLVPAAKTPARPRAAESERVLGA